MTEWEDPNESAGIKQLRKKFKEQGKLIEQLMAERETYQVRNRTADVGQALASRGLDPRLAKFYPEGSATDDTSVDQWVEENKDLFGNRRVVDQGNLQDSTLTDSEKRGYQAINDIAAYNTSVQMDLNSRLDKIQYDPQNPDAAQQELFSVLKEFEGYINQ